MYDEYFNELDPKKREAILNHLLESEDNEQLRQMQQLFWIRYFLDKNQNYRDQFIKTFLSIKMIAQNLGESLAKKKNMKKMNDALHELCLDRTNEFSQEVLYHEMHHLISLYVSTCFEDSNYRSSVLGLGRIDDTKLKQRIDGDLSQIWNIFSQYFDENEPYLLLKNAIMDVKDELMS